MFKSKIYFLFQIGPFHITCMYVGTDVNSVDSRGVTPLHLANSRLRLARESDDIGGLRLSRKPEMLRIVEMVQEYLNHTHCSQDETDELERLAGKLSLSDTPEQVECNLKTE